METLSTKVSISPVLVEKIMWENIKKRKKNTEYNKQKLKWNRNNSKKNPNQYLKISI